MRVWLTDRSPYLHALTPDSPSFPIANLASAVTHSIKRPSQTKGAERKVHLHIWYPSEEGRVLSGEEDRGHKDSGHKVDRTCSSFVQQVLMMSLLPRKQKGHVVSHSQISITLSLN